MYIDFSGVGVKVRRIIGRTDIDGRLIFK